MQKITSRLIVVISGTLASGCDQGSIPPGGGSPDAGTVPSACAPKIPGTYGSPNFATNAAAELQLRAQTTAFLQPMRAAAMDLALRPKAADMKALFEMGMPSLRALTTSYYAPTIDVWLVAFEAAAGNSWKPAEPPPATGGKYGADIFTPDGVDIRQPIEKGMFGATHYNQALVLMDGSVTTATVDRLLALFGSSPSFPAHDAMLMPADTWAAVYAKRRTKAGDVSGMYFKIKSTFVAAQAAAEGGAPCAETLRATLQALKESWEKVIFSTVIYYANDARVKLTKDAATEADIYKGLHAIGEAIGFVHGFRGLPATGRTVTDAQIDKLLGLFGAPATGAVTVYKFATDTATQATRLEAVITELMSIYGFSPAEADAFKVTN